jgi:hypothetical protein
VALVATIDRLLNREGYTIRGARQALEGDLRVNAPVALDKADEGPVSAPLAADRETAPMGKANRVGNRAGCRGGAAARASGTDRSGLAAALEDD